jgi:hypothetical protein
VILVNEIPSGISDPPSINAVSCGSRPAVLCSATIRGR